MAAKRIVQGEELTITYTNLLMPTFMRRQKLKENWYFDCACIRLVFFLTLFTFDSNLANVLQVRGSKRIWNLCLCHQVCQQMRKQVITPSFSLSQRRSSTADNFFGKDFNLKYVQRIPF